MALLAASFTAMLLLPEQGRTMDLMVADFGLYANIHQGDDTVLGRAYAAAGWMGASRAREIVERGPFYDAAGSPTRFGYSTLDRWVADVAANEMRPFLTLTNARIRDSQGNDVLTARQRLADPATYGAWCGEVAARYDGTTRPKVNDFSVWNEPNLPRVGHLSSAVYLNYYAACRYAIKQANPSANVYYGELSTGEVDGTDACQWLIDSTGGATVVTEGVAVHPYQFVVDPTQPVPRSAACQGIGKLSQWPAKIAAARLRTAGGGAPQLLVSEFGYCSARTPSDQYLPDAGQAGCSAGGAANILPPAQHALWTARAWEVARAAGATVFNYHTLAKRNHWQWNGNRNRVMWETGILDNPHPAPVDPGPPYTNGSYGASIGALRAATGAVEPGVAATPATGVFRDRVRLNGLVNPRGWGRTTYWFEYGTTTAYGSSTAPRTVDNGVADITVDAALDGLQPGRTYHFRLHAKSRAGTATSSNMTVTLPDVSRPAVVAPSDGTRFVFYRGVGGRLWVRHWDGSAWSAVDLGVETIGSPSAGVHGDVYAYARGSNGHLWQFSWNGRSWTTWDMGLDVAGDPALQVTGAMRAAYVRGANGNLWQVMWNGSAWTHWDMGHAVDGTPTVLSNVIYIRGANRSIWELRWADGEWTHWDTGRVSAGDPAVVLASTNTDGPRTIWFRGENGHLHHLAWNGAAWLDWDTGVTATGDPTVTDNYIYYRGANGHLWQLNWTGNDWTWWDMGYGTVGDPAYASQWGTRYWYFRGGADHLFQVSWNGLTSWQVWDMGT